MCINVYNYRVVMCSNVINSVVMRCNIYKHRVVMCSNVYK